MSHAVQSHPGGCPWEQREQQGLWKAGFVVERGRDAPWFLREGVTRLFESFRDEHDQNWPVDKDSGVVGDPYLWKQGEEGNISLDALGSSQFHQLPKQHLSQTLISGPTPQRSP